MFSTTSKDSRDGLRASYIPEEKTTHNSSSKGSYTNGHA